MKKLRNYLTVVDKFTKPGFAKLLGTDPKTLLSGVADAIPNASANANCNVSNTNEQTNPPMGIRGDYPYSFRYKIPKHACIPIQNRIHGNDNGNKDISKTSPLSSVLVLPLSGYLALFDEYTTFALMNEDTKTRPGVSVSLSTQLCQRSYFDDFKKSHTDIGNDTDTDTDADTNDDIDTDTNIVITPTTPKNSQLLPCAGDEVEIQVRVTKIGNLFGFAEARAICYESRDIIASGKHMKYLPVGSIAQKIVLGYMLPLSAKIASLWEYIALSSQADNKEGRAKVEEPQSTMHEVLLSMKKNDQLNDYGNFFFTVKDDHCNPLGSLHGGCQAILMESIGNELMSDPTKYGLNNVSPSKDKDNNNTNKQCFLESIHIIYMSPGKNDITFQTEVNNTINYINSQCVELNVNAFNVKGRAISEGVLRYQLF